MALLMRAFRPIPSMAAAALLALAVLTAAPAQPALAESEAAAVARLTEELAASFCGRPSAQGPSGGPDRYDPMAPDPLAPWMAKLEVTLDPSDPAAQAPARGQSAAADPTVWTCGAVAIAPQWLATAAHCVARGAPSRYRVTLGARDLFDRAALQREGDLALCHPRYDPSRLRFDVALLRLDRPLPPDFPLLRLARPDEHRRLDPGRPAMAAGWARVGEGRVDRRLRRTPVRIVTPRTEDDGLIEAAPSADAPSLCVGESGAPLIADVGGGPALFGVFSSVDVVWDAGQGRLTELCDGFEARSYFTPLRGDVRLWIARAVSACARTPEICGRTQ